jgi:hypothetical protein
VHRFNQQDLPPFMPLMANKPCVNLHMKAGAQTCMSK